MKVLTDMINPDQTSIAERFAAEGYVVLPGAMPADLIDQVLLAQRASRRNPLLIFRGQGVVGYERARWNPQGQMVRSIQNPHLLGLVPRLSSAIRRLVFSGPMAEALSACTGQSCWVNWQTMLVDRSVIPQMGRFRPTGVCPQLVWNVRRGLDQAGFPNVKIVVSGAAGQRSPPVSARASRR